MTCQGRSHDAIIEKSGLTFNPSYLRHCRPKDGGVMRLTTPNTTLRIIPICLLAGMHAMLHAAETSEVVEWIRANAIRLETPAAGNGFTDMQPLKKMIGNARIVSLGEATHGSREFFQLKHRMLEFLATEMGFSIFSLEANMPEAYRLNDLVLNGKGDPVRLISGIPPWITQEVLDMVLWMREFNKSGKRRLQFTGFDMQSLNLAAKTVDAFVADADLAYADSLRQATELARNVLTTIPGKDYGTASATFPVKDAAGKRIRFSGYIRTEDVTTGYAGLWWRVDGPSGRLAFDNMQNRGVSGTTDWKRCNIELTVAADAQNINFGFGLPGNGTAWFDGLAVELDGVPYLNNDLFDFDLESATPKGFHTVGNGYRVQLDSQVFYSGKQSLRMSRVAPAGNPKGVGPALASSRWKDVVLHLETSREVYRKKGAPARDIEWAIQNARVVLQCMQMRANEATRDKSMADNVKWILDQNPTARIVLWAHNGHVSASGEGSGDSMGSYLRRMYGDKMVVFGFAFNQGSFWATEGSYKAIEMAKGVHVFTVPPAPDGSLDSTLAATGIPIFAIDLRLLPLDEPVGRWFRSPRKSRSIGAVYSDKEADYWWIETTAPEDYDALLFVEKTTAAHGKPAVSILSCQVGDYTEQLTIERECGDLDYSLSFKLPAGWRIGRAIRIGDRETSIAMSNPESQTANLWYKVLKPQRKMTTGEIWRALVASADEEVVQRVNQGRTDYRIRPDSPRAHSVRGHLALSCVADFTQDGRNMAEYLTWIRSDSTSALFFGRVPATELDRFRESFDQIIETLRFP